MYFEMFNNYIFNNDFMYFVTFTDTSNLIILDSLGNEIDNIAYNFGDLLIYLNNNKVNSAYIDTDFEFIMFDSQANKTIELDIDTYCKTLYQLDDDEFLIEEFGTLYKYNIMNEYEEITTGYEDFWNDLSVDNNGNYFIVGYKDNENYYIKLNENYDVSEESIIIHMYYNDDYYAEKFYIINDNVVRKVTLLERVEPLYWEVDT